MSALRSRDLPDHAAAVRVRMGAQKACITLTALRRVWVGEH
mgnify:CR=1 FL=1